MKIIPYEQLIDYIQPGTINEQCAWCGDEFNMEYDRPVVRDTAQIFEDGGWMHGEICPCLQPYKLTQGDTR